MLSNDAFYHENPKISDALTIILGVIHNRGPRKGHRKLKDFAPKLRQDMYTPCRARLGCTREAQLKVIEEALQVAVDRHLVGFDLKEQKLFRTRKGHTARKLYLQRRNAAKSGRDKLRMGQPAYAR